MATYHIVASGLENPMDRGAWQATGDRFTKSVDTTERSRTSQLDSYFMFLHLYVKAIVNSESVFYFKRQGHRGLGGQTVSALT